MGFLDFLVLKLEVAGAKKIAPSIEQEIKNLGREKMSQENQMSLVVKRFLENSIGVALNTERLKKEDFYKEKANLNNTWVDHILLTIQDAIKIPIEFRNKYPDVPWQDIIDMQDGLLLNSKDFSIDNYFVTYHGICYSDVARNYDINMDKA